MRLALCLMLALALACGGGTETQDAENIGTTGDEEAIEAPPPLDPLTLLPADSLSVTTVDVERLRTSPYYSTIHGWLDLIEELSPTQREAVDTALNNTQLAHVSVVDRPCGSHCWTLASVYLGSSLEPSAANATLQQLAEGEQFAPREVAGHPAFGDGQGALIAVEPGKYLVGPHRYTEPALQQPQRPRHEANDAVAAAVQALAGTQSTIMGWVIGDETTQALLARETPFSSALTALVRGAAYRVDMANGLIVDVVATTADANAAATFSDGVRREIDALTSGLAARAMGISVLGEATQVSAQGDQVRVTLQLSDEQLRPLLSRADSLLRLVN